MQTIIGFNWSSAQRRELAAPVCCTIGSSAKGTARAARLFFSYSSNEERHAACWRLTGELCFFIVRFILLPAFSFALKLFQENFFCTLTKAFTTLHFPMYFLNYDYVYIIIYIIFYIYT